MLEVVSHASYAYVACIWNRGHPTAHDTDYPEFEGSVMTAGCSRNDTRRDATQRKRTGTTCEVSLVQTVFR